MKKSKLAEKDRQALVEKWESTPSPNPRFRGMTPREVARALVRRPPHASDKGRSAK